MHSPVAKPRIGEDRKANHYRDNCCAKQVGPLLGIALSEPKQRHGYRQSKEHPAKQRVTPVRLYCGCQ